MKDFRKLKHNMEMATELLTSINEEVQELPDQAGNPKVGSPLYKKLNNLIQGFTEFKPYFDTCYEPFKPIVEERLKRK